MHKIFVQTLAVRTLLSHLSNVEKKRINTIIFIQPDTGEKSKKKPGFFFPTKNKKINFVSLIFFMENTFFERELYANIYPFNKIGEIDYLNKNLTELIKKK